MIGRLKGLYDGQSDDFAIIDCGGVGYRVFASARTLGQLTAIGQAVALEIETQVREDHIHLFGFLSEVERDLFRLLLSVQGVGAKVALAVLSTFTPDQLLLAIGSGDQAAIKTVKGVGPKAAQRIVAELKDKVGGLSGLGTGVALSSPGGPSATAGSAAGAGEAGKAGEAGAAGAAGTFATSGIVSDVTSALANLGYQQSQAFEAASKAVSALNARGEAPTVEAAIVMGLKMLSTAN